MNVYESPEQKSATQQKLDAYNEVVIILKEVRDLELDTNKKIGIAWMVEYCVRKNPEKWQIEIKEIGNKIQDLNEKTGKVGVTQFLSRKIKEEYLDDLNTEVTSETNEEHKKSLNNMIKVTSWMLENLKKRENEKEATSFGGISIDRIPEWFPKE